MIESQRHSYHLVDPSPWPISGSLGALATTVGGVMYMHSFQGGATLLSLGLIFLLYTLFVWWRDVPRESTLEGHHTKAIQLGSRYGSILFIVSEVMFLFAFFWASSFSPTESTGSPKGIEDYGHFFSGPAEAWLNPLFSVLKGIIIAIWDADPIYYNKFVVIVVVLVFLATYVSNHACRWRAFRHNMDLGVPMEIHDTALGFTIKPLPKAETPQDDLILNYPLPSFF